MMNDPLTTPRQPLPNLIRRAFGHDRMAHAYILEGPAGIGKKTAGIMLAAGINCREGVGLDACGSCPGCRKYFSGSHPDLLLVEPEGAAIKINQIRTLKQALSFPPLSATTRVVLLDQAHTMKREAANSLLKILEEPPSDTILILMVPDAHLLLATIVSRCQRVRMYPPAIEDAAAEIAASLHVEPNRARALAELADGVATRARDLAKRKVLDYRDRFVELLTSGDPEDPTTLLAVFELSQEVAGLKGEIPEFLDALRSLLLDLALCAAGVPPRRNPDLAGRLAQVVHRYPPQLLLDRLALVSRAERELARNCTRALVLEVLLLQLLAPPLDSPPSGSPLFFPQ